MTIFDLHMHSRYSNDGEFRCEELMKKVKAAQLKTIALSDHNTIQGVDEMLRLGKQYHVQVIPAIECDTLFEEFEVHVLGYGIDHHHPYFQDLKERLSKDRAATMRQRIEKLNQQYGMDLDADALLSRFGTKNPFPQIVDTFLNDPRYCHKPEFQPYRPGGDRCEPASVNFYWDHCSAGTPCYVRVDYPSLQDTVKILHEAGGIAVIAHPFRNFYKREDRLDKAIQAGVDGIEAYSNYHTAEQNAYYAQYCHEKGVLMSCGSDFHGKMKPAIRLGEYGYDGTEEELILERFLHYLTTRSCFSL